MFSHDFDVVVVGARCAGAATARLMAERGMRVLVVDRAPPGTDTVSSHNLTRGACMQLARWGLSDRLLEAGTPRIDRTHLYFGENVTELEVKPVLGAPGMMGTRRPILDTMLVNAAREAGACVWFHTSFRDVTRDASGRINGVRVTDDTGHDYHIRTKLVVGADGLRSTVARRVSAQLRKEAEHSLGHIYAYVRGLPLRGNHAYFSQTALVAATPTDGNAHIVIATVVPERLKVMRKLAGHPWVLRTLAREASAEFAMLLDQTKLVEPIRVFAGTKGRVLDCAGPGWALVGDAGYFRDPVTAHGITDAFRDAELLAEAATAQDDAALLRYQLERDQITEEIWEITDRIAAFDLSLDELQGAYRDLAYAMRTEQAWMQSRFSTQALAA